MRMAQIERDAYEAQYESLTDWVAESGDMAVAADYERLIDRLAALERVAEAARVVADLVNLEHALLWDALAALDGEAGRG